MADEILTNENYFSQENEHDYMSYSQFKDFLKCEAEGLAIAEGRYKKPSSKALLQGSYVDAHFSGEMDAFKEAHPELFKKDGTLKSDYEVCEKAIAAVEGDPYFKENFFSGDSQQVLAGDIAGVKFKGKIDMLYENKIVDMKCMANLEPVWDPVKWRKVPFYVYYRYDIQAAIYQELVYQKTGKRLPYYLAVVTKEDIPSKGVYLFDQDVIDGALELVKNLAPRFDAIKRHEIEPNECGECDYYRSTHMIDITDIKEITMEDYQ